MQFILEIYNKIKKEIVDTNESSIKKYNYYAEKNGLFLCPTTPKNKYRKSEYEQELLGSKSIKKLYEVEIKEDKDKQKKEQDDNIR